MSKKTNPSAASNPEVKQFCITAMNDDEFRWKLASDIVYLVLWWAACISLHSNARYGSALTGVSGCKNGNNQVIMADACTLSKEGLLDCGSSRGRTETVFLYECRDDVTTHLKIVFFRMQTWKNTRSSFKGLASAPTVPVFSATCVFVHSSSGANNVEFVSALCFLRQGEHIAYGKIKEK